MRTVSRPAVSVMLPCFNAGETLPLALASLVAQTHTDWECVCIDDGSTDNTGAVLEDAARRDSRFRVERFPENRGRGAARQRVLELIRGHYLAFLDADDWMYPARLAHEVHWLEAEPRIAAVSVCAAATRDAEIIGVLRPAVSSLPAIELFSEPKPPPILFPASMIRAELGRATGFDPRFRRSQDSDFLIRALLGNFYALSAEVLYAYSTTAQTWKTTNLGYRYRMQAHLRHLREYPVRVTRTVVTTAAKTLVYRVAGALGMDPKLVARRWKPVDEITAQRYHAARTSVLQVQRNFWQ